MTGLVDIGGIVRTISPEGHPERRNHKNEIDDHHGVQNHLFVQADFKKMQKETKIKNILRSIPENNHGLLLLNVIMVPEEAPVEIHDSIIVVMLFEV